MRTRLGPSHRARMLRAPAAARRSSEVAAAAPRGVDLGLEPLPPGPAGVQPMGDSRRSSTPTAAIAQAQPITDSACACSRRRSRSLRRSRLRTRTDSARGVPAIEEHSTMFVKGSALMVLVLSVSGGWRSLRRLGILRGNTWDDECKVQLSLESGDICFHVEFDAQNKPTVSAPKEAQRRLRAGEEPAERFRGRSSSSRRNRSIVGIIQIQLSSSKGGSPHDARVVFGHSVWQTKEVS